jgi:hypothetical protein
MNEPIKVLLSVNTEKNRKTKLYRWLFLGRKPKPFILNGWCRRRDIEPSISGGEELRWRLCG